MEQLPYSTLVPGEVAQYIPYMNKASKLLVKFAQMLVYILNTVNAFLMVNFAYCKLILENVIKNCVHITQSLHVTKHSNVTEY